MIGDRTSGDVDATHPTFGTSQRTAAIIAGVGLLLMTVAAMFAMFVHSNVIVPGDAGATANNILADELQFRLSILSFLTIIILDVIVAWGLYLFFSPVNRHLSLLAAWFRVVYAAVFLVTILDLGHAVRLLHSADTMAVLGTEQLQAQALLSLNAFSDGWALALGVFGLHLIVVGYLAFKAGYVPTILGALLVIAGLGYVFDAVAGFLFPTFGMTVGQFTFIGEVLLALWLVIKSVRVEQWKTLTPESA